MAEAAGAPPCSSPMRWSVLLGIAFGMGLSACGGGSHLALPGSTIVASPTSVPVSTTAISASECTNAQIAIAFVGTQGAGGVNSLAEFSIRGSTATGCRTIGYPGIQLVSQGQDLPTQAAHGPGTLTHAGSPQMVTLSTSEVGFFTIEYTRSDANGASCPVVTSVSVIVPDQQESTSVPTPSTGVGFTPCDDGAVTVTPIQSGSPP
jgi:hypothetical protein